MNWWKDLRGKVRLNESLKAHTTFKIGGPAKFFIMPKDVWDLKLLLNLLKRYKIPFLVMGVGSNILVCDKGIEGAVLKLNSPYFKKVEFKDSRIEVGPGVLLNQVLVLAEELGLSGLEFLAGIPGTVGGALIMNAGAQGECISDLVENVTVMDYNGKIKALNKRNIKFDYRKSNLAKYIILSTHLRLARKNRQEIKDSINKYITYRKLTQDLSKPSAGCIFKNPKGCSYSAGQLIDLCGLKGKRIGDACVSLKHANFIVNLKNAKAREVSKLMGLIINKVKSKFNITLKPEIKIWQ
jgi:UDP-N-acetylmuramate dehydrogenase